MSRLQIGLRYWALSLVVCLAALMAIELALRSEVLWRLPQGVALAAPNDMEGRSTWWSYQPPSAADRHVWLLGASTACASMELPGDGTSARLTERMAGATVSFRPLCAGRAGFADYLAYLENALAHGGRPHLVVAYTGPAMFTDASIEKSLAQTHAIPLVSHAWLDTLERLGQSSTMPGSTVWWLRHSAVARHRYYVNSWVRQRVQGALEGRFAWRLAFDENRYRRARTRPLETDTDRFERTAALRTEFRPYAAADSGLVTLLDVLAERRIPTLLVEAPRSPPVRGLLEPLAADYRTLLESLAEIYGSAYIDPNDFVVLGPELFADLYHVSWDGRERWLEQVMPHVMRLISDARP